MCSSGCMAGLESEKKRSADGTRFGGQRVFVFTAPEQKLVIYGEQCPVILNTHFSQKVLSKDSVENRPNSREKSRTKKTTPPPLAQIFNLTETKRNASNTDILAQQGTSNSKVTALSLQMDTRGSEDSVCDSLLEVIESQAAVGWTGVDVKVVVQRVYCLPLGELLSQPLIRNSTIRRAQAFSSEQPNASAAPWKLPSSVGKGIAWTRTRDVQTIGHVLHSTWSAFTGCATREPINITFLNLGTSNSKVTALSLQMDTRGSEDSVCDSLLEVIESQAAVGWTGVDVKVVVQRVYCLPLGELLSQPLIRNSTIRRAQAFSSEQPNARLCLLVQDVYGIFSEVQLHTFCSSKEKLQQDSEKWEGRSCYLKSMKVLQRTTRGRRDEDKHTLSSEACAVSRQLLYTLQTQCTAATELQRRRTTQLWAAYRQARRRPARLQGSLEDDVVLLAPSFCYVLAACREEGSVQVLQEETVSDLYLPPVVHHLREILQGVPGRQRCSFSATVVYKRLQNEDPVQSEFWLFVTDAGLQSESEHGPGIPRVVSVCVTTSCVLHPAIVNALKSDTSCHLTFTFKDAVREHGSILCVERTVLKLEPQPSLTNSVKLDELNPTTKINSLCTVKGTIVAVDEENAYSWPACDRCGNEKLEAAHEEQQGYFENTYSSVVVWQGESPAAARGGVARMSRPTMKMQLEVFLHSVSHPECTVKVKLQQETITSLLTSATSDSEGYEVESVLGKEVSPLNCYVRLIARKPAIWIGLEEISL
ncbi:UNVERIFIED_CONTAM: hypothetical protein FKN15_007800 [Acipenser sinensis]